MEDYLNLDVRIIEGDGEWIWLRKASEGREWKEIEGKSEKKMKMENERRIKRNWEGFKRKSGKIIKIEKEKKIDGKSEKRKLEENEKRIKKMRKENQESLKG